MKKIAEFAASIETTRGENLRVIVGLQAIRVIADMKTLEAFRQTLNPKDIIISYTTDLAEISLLFPEEAKKIPGNAAKITTQLALHDVNLAGIQMLSRRHRIGSGDRCAAGLGSSAAAARPQFLSN
jgi:hypothetical protein